jgi:type 1 glutamine amidotransferase
VAVVEGFHPFEVPQWHALWRSFEGLECYVQHIDNWAVDCAGCQADYDVVLFYNMTMKVADSPFRDALAASLARLGESGQGIVVLHHAILAYPDEPCWTRMVGIEDRSFGFHVDQEFTLQVARPDHPIARGIAASPMQDETYTMAEPGNDSEVLFTVNHDPSMEALGWTRHYRESRVFCFQPGHDHLAYENPVFRRILQQGVLWCANRLG